MVRAACWIFARNIEFEIRVNFVIGSRCIMLMETLTPENIQEAEAT
jgi:hypothetical protein